MTEEEIKKELQLLVDKEKFHPRILRDGNGEDIGIAIHFMELAAICEHFYSLGQNNEEPWQRH